MITHVSPKYSHITQDHRDDRHARRAYDRPTLLVRRQTTSRARDAHRPTLLDDRRRHATCAYETTRQPTDRRRQYRTSPRLQFTITSFTSAASGATAAGPAPSTSVHLILALLGGGGMGTRRVPAAQHGARSFHSSFACASPTSSAVPPPWTSSAATAACSA